MLITLIGVAFFCALGAWQIARAHQKQRLFAAFAGAGGMPAVSLAVARAQGEGAIYPHVRVRGHFVAGRSYVLDDKVRDGHQGVMVYSVLIPQDGGALLVNRGFLPRTRNGALPEIPPAPAGEQVLQGLYAPPPGSGLRIGGNRLPLQKAWPKIAIYLDLDEIAADFGRPLDSRVLLLDPVAGAGFVREWRPQVFPPARHFGYAVTWFTFALVALVIFIGMHWRTDALRQ